MKNELHYLCETVKEDVNTAVKHSEEQIQLIFTQFLRCMGLGADSDSYRVSDVQQTPSQETEGDMRGRGCPHN